MSTNSVPQRRPSGNPQTPIYVAGRAVGHVAGDTFRKTCRASKHMLRQPRGWASDVAALRAALMAGATYLEIEDAESGAVYRASIADLLDRGVHFNRGFGDQVALPLDKWLRPDLGQGEQLSFFAAMEAAR